MFKAGGEIKKCILYARKTCEKMVLAFQISKFVIYIFGKRLFQLIIRENTQTITPNVLFEKSVGSLKIIFCLTLYQKKNSSGGNKVKMQPFTEKHFSQIEYM
jgi:hypothetical protein